MDLIDDEDVKLMFDEWADYIAEEGKAARNAKLHIYMDWQSKNRAEAGMPSGSHHAAAGLDCISDTASADTPVAGPRPLLLWKCGALMSPHLLRSHHWASQVGMHVCTPCICEHCNCTPAKA